MSFTNYMAGLRARAKSDTADSLIAQNILAENFLGKIGGGFVTHQVAAMPDQNNDANLSGVLNGMQNIIDDGQVTTLLISTASNIYGNGGSAFIKAFPAPKALRTDISKTDGRLNRSWRALRVIPTSHGTANRFFIFSPIASGQGYPRFADVMHNDTIAYGHEYDYLLPGDVVDMVYKPSPDSADAALWPGRWVTLCKIPKNFTWSYNFNTVAPSSGNVVQGLSLVNALGGIFWSYNIASDSVATTLVMIGGAIFGHFNYVLQGFGGGPQGTNDSTWRIGIAPTEQDSLMAYRNLIPSPLVFTDTYAVGSWMTYSGVVSPSTPSGGIFAQEGAASGSTASFIWRTPPGPGAMNYNSVSGFLIAQLRANVSF